MSKKYFWLRLKRDFFKRHDIQIIEGMPNGKEIILFYMKLMCESVDHEGRLRFSDEIPYTKEMLARITNTDAGIVETAIDALMKLHMVEILEDETFYIPEVPKLLGFETDWAKKKREYRKGQNEDNVLAMSSECPQDVLDVSSTCPPNVRQEIEIEKEKEIELEIEKEKNNYLLIADMYNDTCVSFPRLKTLSDARKKALKARLNFYTVDDFKRLFEMAEASDFLKGRNDNNWTATFDWMIKDSNMAKILDGNYENRAKVGKSFDMISRWAEEG